MKRHIHIFGAVLLLAVLTGHAQSQSTLNPAGPAARSLSGVSWFVYILFIAVAVVMWVLIWRIATRRRGTFDEHAPVDVGGGQSWVLIGGFIIPSIILAVTFILGLVVMRRFPIHDQKMDHEMAASEIRLTGHQWWWEARYVGGSPDAHFATANEIHIPVGRPVNLELLSADVIHSFWVPNLSGKVDLIPGQVNRMRIEADRPGVYYGKCAEYCGAQHAHMMIVVVAQPEGEYAAWRAHQLEPASTPASAQELRGAALFLERPCALCHTIRGTPAQGSVAPDLTHMALRKGIAANALANDKANLAAWVTHAQSLKPEVAMPNITQFSGEELQAIVAYLQQLR
jgi:cytochrome c oxidase subunit 2